MRDFNVRQALHADLLRRHAGEISSTVIRDELGIDHGNIFVDVAVVNGELQGFELKSKRDNLDRLPRQIEGYSAVMDRATVVVSLNHLEHALPLLPAWWGVEVAIEQADKSVLIEPHRPAEFNEQINPVRLAKLLWKDEILTVLEERCAVAGFRSKTLRVLLERITQVVELNELREIVRATLKRRASKPPAST